MPHLKYNGRFWRFSSDELFFPGVFAIIGRIFWSALLITVLAITTPRLSRCPNGVGLLVYLYLSLTVFILSILCEGCLVKRSLVGSIVETEKREDGIGKYLTAHIFLGVMQFILSIFGLLVISSRSFIPCINDFKTTQQYDVVLLSVVVISQLIDVTSLLCCCYSFSATKVGEDSIADDHHTATLWEGRCKSVMKLLQIVCCNIFGGSNVEEDLNTVARVLTDFFHHDGFLDVVPSDVVAGIMLVRIQQRDRKLNLYNKKGLSTDSKGFKSFLKTVGDESKFLDLEESCEGEERQPLSSSLSQSMLLSPHSVVLRRDLDKRSEIDRAIVETAAKYAVYMIAIYTHLLALYMRPCTGLCYLCFSKMKNYSVESNNESDCSLHNMCCCQMCRGRSSYSRFQSSPSHSITVKGDNCCRVNHAGLTHLTRDIQSEVVYASYDNDTVAKPFAIFLNRDQRSVVITIRGSMSLEDCITDAIADPVELKAAGEKWGFDGVGRYAHGGFLLAALHIREEIEQSQVLQKLFDPPQSSTCNNCYPSESQGPRERIVANVRLQFFTTILCLIHFL